MDEQDEGSRESTRRRVLTHGTAGLIGWFIGTFLDPFRRFINKLISNTWFGRQAKIQFGYTSSDEFKGKGYKVQIANSGHETAENVAVHLGFTERITGVAAEDYTNTPPSPDVDIEITDGGVSRLDIEFLRRNVQEHMNPLTIHFSVEEGTRSSFAYQIDKDDVIFTAYRYSWTFLGERYYESTEHHIGGEI